MENHPKYCAMCRVVKTIATTISYDHPIRKKDGGLAYVTVENLPIDKCEQCGEEWFTEETANYLENYLATKNNLTQ